MINQILLRFQVRILISKCVIAIGRFIRTNKFIRPRKYFYKSATVERSFFISDGITGQIYVEFQMSEDSSGASLEGGIKIPT